MRTPETIPETEDLSAGTALDIEVEPEVDSDPTGPQRTRPVDREEGADEVMLATELYDDKTIPLFEGVKVVYIGADPHHAPVLPGRVDVTIEGGQRKESRGPDGQKFIEVIGGTRVPKATARYTASYDFRARDATGQKSAMRMPILHREIEVRDRPFQVVRHASHIYWFARRPQDYKIIMGPESRYALREYIARRERARRLRHQFETEVTTR